MIREQLRQRTIRAVSRLSSRLSDEGSSRRNPGWCACCRQDTEFLEAGDWLRDQYICTNCGSIPRSRAVNLTLDRYFAGWERARIHESSPSNDFVGRHAARYTASQYFPDVPLGEERDGDRCEDLERLTFANDTFDLFVTQDVMEHVFRPDRAVREIMRVVKPGGAHVYTTPKHKVLQSSRPRATIDNGEVVHLLEPEYHGNPIGDGRALVTWEYGDDFEQYLWEWCRYPTATYVTRDRSLGLDGDNLDVFVTRKIGPVTSSGA